MWSEEETGPRTVETWMMYFCLCNWQCDLQLSPKEVINTNYSIYLRRNFEGKAALWSLSRAFFVDVYVDIVGLCVVGSYVDVYG